MRKLHSKPSTVKRGNMAMVLVISIAVVLTMFALSTFLMIVVKNQERAQEVSDQYSDIDASIRAVELAGESQIKNIIDFLKSESPDPETMTFDGESFVNTYGNDLKTMTKQILVVDCEVNVSFKRDVKRIVYGQPEELYDLIVISLTLNDGTIYNVGFYGEIMDGMHASAFQRGDFVFVWIT